MSNKADATTVKQAIKRELKPKLRFPEFRDAGEWEVKPLGTVCKITNGKSNAQDHDETGIYPLFDRSEVIKKSNNYFFDCEAVIVPGEGMRFLPKYYRGKFDLHQRAYALKDFRCDSKFIYYTMDLLRDILAAKAVRSTVLSLRLPILENFVIHVPNDTEEQKKIADCLSSIDELVAAQTQKLDTLKTHKKGLMQQLFPAEGETLPKLRFPEFRDAGKWETNTLVQLAKFRRGSFPQPYGLPEWYDEVNGMPFVQVFDVSDDLRLKKKTKNKISALGAEQSVFISKDTLIVTLQGSIGRVAITQYDAYIDRTLLIFEKFFKPTTKLFFAYIIQNLFEIEKEKAPGGIIKTITKESLSDFKVSLPSLSEQQKIAACLSSIDELITAQTQKLATLKSHKKGLMQQLFPSAESQNDLSHG